jgi:hypothetical protein
MVPHHIIYKDTKNFLNCQINKGIFIVMNKKYLDKVVDQLVNETRIGSNGAYTFLPFLLSPLLSCSLSVPSSFLFLPSPVTPHTTPSCPLSSLHPLRIPFSRHPYSLPFYKHCRDVYGLTEEEVDYVWDEYRRSIIKKMTDIS